MDCFVISPIGEENSETRQKADDVLNFIVREALEPLGYSVERADTISESGMITSQIIQRIVDADLVVADLSELNPNVFYELAIRHMIKKPFIHLIQEGNKIPFDVHGSRTIFYSLDLSGGKKATEELTKQASSIKAGAKADSPISVAFDLERLTESNDPTSKSIARIEAELVNIRSDLRTISNSRSVVSSILESQEKPGAAVWTEERVKVLKEMWGAGSSASEISQTLGGVTRNAVIGKIYRLGLGGR